MEKTRERILILFEGPHLAFAPSIAQLYRELEKWYDVTIFALTPSGITDQKPIREKVIYYNYEYGWFKRSYYKVLYRILLLFKVKKTSQFNSKFKGELWEYFSRYRKLERLIRKERYKRIISVDIKNLFYCSLMNIKSDLLSLELCANNDLLPFINRKTIDCVLIQTPERFNYLFPGEKLKTFYIQNAPIYRHIDILAKRTGLIYAGTAWAPFGFYQCLDFLDKNKNEQLFVQGLVPPEDRKRIGSEYANLITEKRLSLPEKYLDDDEMVDFIAQFEIGLCFYDFSIDWINNFNYHSAPSGKLFKYLAAGVPVVCNNIPGFRFVKEQQCGVLVDNLEPESIQKAIQQIRDNYSSYSNNASRVAESFSFDKTVKPYLDHIRA